MTTRWNRESQLEMKVGGGALNGVRIDKSGGHSMLITAEGGVLEGPGVC